MAYEKHTWVHGELITEDKLNCIENGINCLANCSRVWINANPESTFPAQDILIDTTGFSSFEFYFIHEIDNAWHNICISINKNRSYKENGKINSFVKYGNYERRFAVADDKIHFDDCLYAVKYNQKLIPVSIHAFE